MLRRFLIRLALLVPALLVPALLAPAAPALAAGGMVAAKDPRAAAAGQEILRAGGSATDAAMAIMIALTVVEPQSSGLGGGGLFVHHDPKTGLVQTVDGREMAPASARPDRFLGADGKPLPFVQAFPGGKSVGVPGNVRLLAKVHARWGKLPWAALFQPAIRLAEEGFAISGPTARTLALTAKLDADFPDLQALYWQDGKPKPAGTMMKNPALGALLRRIAAEGPDAFYTGQNAQAIGAAVANAPHNPAELTPADLMAYQAKDRPAICGRYRQYKVCGMGPPSSGALTVLQILGLLERFDLARMGKDDPRSWHLIAEAMMLAYADRDAYEGDRDFVDVPIAGLIDPDYIARRSRLLRIDRTLAAYPAGMPPGAKPRTKAPSSEVPSTSNFVAADGAGEVVTMTSTIEGYFGSQLVANGMMLNNELTDFTFAPEKGGAPVANRVEAGKRPLSSMAPTIVYAADGTVRLATGSAGGKRIIMHVVKELIGTLDWGLSAQAATALPNLFFADNGLLVEAGTPLAAMAPALTKLGHTVVPTELISNLTAVEPAPGGGWAGAADPHTEGVALAE